MDIEKERKNLHENLRDLFEKKKVQVTSEPPGEGMYIVVTLVKDYDPQYNEVWVLPANKSYPREDVVCAECKEAVVMSDGMYQKYLQGGRKATVLCTKDALAKAGVEN